MTLDSVTCLIYPQMPCQRCKMGQFHHFLTTIFGTTIWYVVSHYIHRVYKEVATEDGGWGARAPALLLTFKYRVRAPQNNYVIYSDVRLLAIEIL